MGRRGNHDKGWFQLDNAAMMYSAIQSGTYSAVYRFSAVMARAVCTQGARTLRGF